MENKDIKNLPTINLVYVGYRLINGNHWHVWHRITEAGELCNEWSLKRHKNIAHASPGMIFSFPTDNGGKTLHTGYGTYVSRWEDETAVQQWQAEHQANRLAHREAGKAAKAQKENAALDALQPFRETYRKLNPEKRALMLAWVIRYITHQ